MSDRQRLLLAVCICEWAGALDHIDAAMRTGFVEPVPYATLGRVQRELRDLLNQWASATERLLRTPEDDARMVEEACAYATAHQSEIDELTNGTEGN
jgi:hypothetical protein